MAAASETEPPAAEPSAPPPAIVPQGEEASQLDKLMKLPSSLDYGAGERGGMTPGEWRARYRALREDLAWEREALEVAQAELEKIAGGSDAWTLAPAVPGVAAATADAPLDYELRQSIRRHKAEIEHLERALRELDVRADLAGVPAEWRE